MMTLISLGITVAFGTSLAGTFGLLEIEVWWELATLTTIMILVTGSKCGRFPKLMERSTRSPPYCQIPRNA
jgi:hypothetical protein